MSNKSFILLSVFIFLGEIQFVAGQSESISSLKYLGEYDVPFNAQFRNTTIGGLSGIDYDPANQVYYIISDDRSAINPARYYTAKLNVTEKGIDSVQFVGVHYFLQLNGEIYKNFKNDPTNAPDPESIRYYPKTSQLVWTSEGERSRKKDRLVLQNPSINSSRLDGRYISSFPTPTNACTYVTELGSRQNGSLEGIAFSQDYTSMFTSMEEPLYQDGPRAELIRNKALIRIYKWDVESKQNVAQYAYELDPVAYLPVTPNAFIVNGVTEILSVGENKLLVMERSYSTGRIANTIKVFIADLAHASDVMFVSSLKEKPPERLIEKKLLLNMDSLGIFIDNMEGVTFGPPLPNGHQTLVFVSDNNFSSLEKTQFLLFEVIP